VGIRPPFKLGKQDPKTVVIVAVLGAVVVAVGNPAIRSSVVPAAAAQNTVRAFFNYHPYIVV
jgi:hypothetical protein